MKKIKQLFRKGVALALAAVTTLSVLPAATVSAASQRATITFAYCYDGNGNTIRYQQTASHNGVTFSHAGEARTRIYADGDNAYCIEPGISLHTGNTLEKDASVVWNNLGKAKQDAVNLALLYGAQGSMGSLSGTEDEKVLATQMVIWEIVTGCRNASAPYAQTDAKFYNSLCVGGANSGIAGGLSADHFRYGQPRNHSQLCVWKYRQRSPGTEMGRQTVCIETDRQQRRPVEIQFHIIQQ